MRRNRFSHYKAWGFLWGIIGVIILFSMYLFATYTKPPVEKVQSLKRNFRILKLRDAKGLSPAEYERVNREMNRLDMLMIKKDYKEAKSLMNSMDGTLKIIKREIDLDDSKKRQLLEVFGLKLDNLKGSVNKETISLLKFNELQMYNLKVTGFKQNLEQSMKSGSYQQVYDDAMSLAKKMAAEKKAIQKRDPYHAAQLRKYKKER
ncbi:hypothetical protein ACFL60_04650 [Candidatus Omnitrophota bacterium]